MSQYYRGRRSKASSFYVPGRPFRLSRTQFESFMNCPRCFYIDRRLGLGTPPGFPFAINSRVDGQLKLVYDRHRAAGTAPVEIEAYGIRPATHSMLDTWRNNFKGVEREFEGLTIFGAIDDLMHDAGAYAPLDYKATAKAEIIDALDPNAEHHRSYEFQMDFYGWLLAGHLPMSGRGYWLYCTAPMPDDPQGPDVHFEQRVITRKLDMDRVPEVIDAAKRCLDGDEIPASGPNCDMCLYTSTLNSVVLEHGMKRAEAARRVG